VSIGVELTKMRTDRGMVITGYSAVTRARRYEGSVPGGNRTTTPFGSIGPPAHSVSRQLEMTYWRDSHFGQNASIRSRSGGPARRLPAHPLPVYSGRVDRAR